MKKILIVYDSGYGATKTVAGIIEKSFIKNGFGVDSLPAGSHQFDDYDAVLVGSPIHVGKCSGKISKFLKDNCHLLREKPLAFFFTCMSVTQNKDIKSTSLFVDPGFNLLDGPSRKLNFMEKKHTSSFYFQNLKKLIGEQTPVGLAFFKGNLVLSDLSLMHWFVMKLAMFFMPEIKEGRFVNPETVNKWSDNLAAVFREK